LNPLRDGQLFEVFAACVHEAELQTMESPVSIFYYFVDPDRFQQADRIESAVSLGFKVVLQRLHGGSGDFVDALLESLAVRAAPDPLQTHLAFLRASA